MKFQLFLVGVLAVAAFAAPVAEFIDEDCLEEEFEAPEVEDNVQEQILPAFQDEPLLSVRVMDDVEEEADCEEELELATEAPVEIVDEECEEEEAEVEPMYQETDDYEAGYADPAGFLMGDGGSEDYIGEDCEEVEAAMVDEGRGDFEMNFEEAFEEAPAVLQDIGEEAEVADEEECEEY